MGLRFFFFLRTSFFGWRIRLTSEHNLAQLYSSMCGLACCTYGTGTVHRKGVGKGNGEMIGRGSYQVGNMCFVDVRYCTSEMTPTLYCQRAIVVIIVTFYNLSPFLFCCCLSYLLSWHASFLFLPRRVNLDPSSLVSRLFSPLPTTYFF